MAGAQRGAVGQGIRAQRDGFATGIRQDECRRVLGCRDAVGDVLQQGVVARVVADQYRAQHLLAVPRDDQAAIDAVGLVTVAIADRALGFAVCVTDGADIHAQQLELGGHVGALEAEALLRGACGIASAGSQQGRHAAGHLIARRDQPEDARLPQGALADGEDFRV